MTTYLETSVTLECFPGEWNPAVVQNNVAYENTCSLNFVHSYGSVKSIIDVERESKHLWPVPTGSTDWLLA